MFRLFKLINKTQCVCLGWNRDQMNCVKIVFLLSMLCNCVHLRAMRAVQLSAVCTLCKHVMCKLFLESATFVHYASRSPVCHVLCATFVLWKVFCETKTKCSLSSSGKSMCTKHPHQISVIIFIVSHNDYHRYHQQDQVYMFVHRTQPTVMLVK